MQVETLEPRRLLAVTASFSEGVLIITGDNESNAVNVRRNETGQIIVRAGDAVVKTVGYADVKAIRVSLLGGNDRLEIAQNIEKPTTISGGEGNDLLAGGGTRDSINGDAGHDTLRGGRGADGLFGSDGNDFLDGGDHGDVLSGGGGIDTVSYAGRPGSVKVTLDNLANDGGIGSAATADRPAIPPENDNVRSDVERIIGGNGSDNLSAVGAPGNVTLEGGAGNDVLTGGAFNDLLAGGSGNDNLQGGSGNDTLNGGEGSDRMSGGVGLDLVTYADRTAGIIVTMNDNTANDGTPARVATATEPARPAEGDNVLGDVERLAGGRGNDRMIGNDASNTLSGGLGNDFIDARGGNDIVEGGDGNDVIYGGTGDDRLYAGRGEDKLFGQDGNDWLYGRDGSKDTLDGGSGAEDRAQRDELDVLVGVEVILA